MTCIGEPDSGPEVVDPQSTVAFVDLVRFTSLTDVHGDWAGADAATALEEVVLAALSDGSRLVKTLGDGVLLIVDSPGEALRCVAEIIEALHELGGGSDARGGLHAGPVVTRNDDIFGSTVNMAARIVSLAAPGTLVVTRSVAASADAVGMHAAPLGSLEIPGFVQPVELFQIDPCDHDGHWLADPVCGMRIEAERAIARRQHGGNEIGFCSERCSEIFARAPGKFGR